MPAVNHHIDTLASNWISGQVALPASRTLLNDLVLPSGIVYPEGWINTLQVRLYTSANAVIASLDANEAEVPLPPDVWFPLSVVGVDRPSTDILADLYLKQVGGSGSACFFILEGRSTQGNA